MKISNLLFLDCKRDNAAITLISGNDEIKNFLISFGSIENDKTIELLGSSYSIEEFKIELISEEFLNIDLYLKRLLD